VEKVLARKIRQSAEKERLVKIDCGYIQDVIEDWWQSNAGEEKDDETLKSELKELVNLNIDPRDKEFFSRIAEAGDDVAAICITGLFRTPDTRLGLIVHEGMSDLFRLNDIKYDYEDHKRLYVKPEGLTYKSWGNGRGEITPHCDDLYEKVDPTLLALTVARDETQTSTTFYQTKHVIKDLSDIEIEKLSRIEADFISGKNVKGGVRYNSRKVLEFNEEKSDVKIAMDFRIDDENGQRMITKLRSDTALLEKIGASFDQYDHISSVPETGTFLIVANRKGLHAREMLQLNEEQIERIKTGDVELVPRLLYRSKGPKTEESENTR
jgi:hypothetical protein